MSGDTRQSARTSPAQREVSKSRVPMRAMRTSASAAEIPEARITSARKKPVGSFANFACSAASAGSR